MICPNCGSEVADGSAVCNFCGATLTMQTGFDPNMQQGYNPNMQPGFDPNMQQPVYQAAPAPAKKNTGLIVGISVGALVLVAAVIVILKLFVFGGGKTDGKYVCDTFAAFGMDCYLEVKGDKATMVMSYDADGDGKISDDEKDSSEGSIKFDGDVCTITMDGDSLDCDYDSKKGTITISDDSMGMEMVFTKK